MAPFVKLAAVAGALVLAAFGLGGGKAGGRKPYLKPIDVPGNDTPWDPFDDAICLCWEAGEKEGAALVDCALARVYPDVQWPALPIDHPSVMRTWQATGARVAEFLKDPETFCKAAPPPPPGDDIATPSEVADLIKAQPAHFLPITKSGPLRNPSFAAQHVYGATGSNVPRGVRAFAASGFNLLFCSRKKPASAYTFEYNGHHYDIGPAWMPWNDRIVTSATSKTKLHRKVNWSGTSNVAGSEHAYFTPWAPPLDDVGGVLTLRSTDPWDPINNPPERVLRALGWTLDEMRTAWLAGNP
jgi:hypothetical protein